MKEILIDAYLISLVLNYLFLTWLYFSYYVNRNHAHEFERDFFETLCWLSLVPFLNLLPLFLTVMVYYQCMEEVFKEHSINIKQKNNEITSNRD